MSQPHFTRGICQIVLDEKANDEFLWSDFKTYFDDAVLSSCQELYAQLPQNEQLAGETHTLSQENPDKLKAANQKMYRDFLLQKCVIHSPIEETTWLATFFSPTNEALLDTVISASGVKVIGQDERKANQQHQHTEQIKQCQEFLTLIQHDAHELVNNLKAMENTPLITSNVSHIEDGENSSASQGNSTDVSQQGRDNQIDWEAAQHHADMLMQLLVVMGFTYLYFSLMQKCMPIRSSVNSQKTQICIKKLDSGRFALQLRLKPKQPVDNIFEHARSGIGWTFLAVLGGFTIDVVGGDSLSGLTSMFLQSAACGLLFSSTMTWFKARYQSDLLAQFVVSIAQEKLLFSHIRGIEQFWTEGIFKHQDEDTQKILDAFKTYAESIVSAFNADVELFKNPLLEREMADVSANCSLVSKAGIQYKDNHSWAWESIIDNLEDARSFPPDQSSERKLRLIAAVVAIKLTLKCGISKLARHNQPYTHLKEWNNYSRRVGDIAEAQLPFFYGEKICQSTYKCPCATCLTKKTVQALDIKQFETQMPALKHAIQQLDVITQYCQAPHTHLK